jgi:flagellar motor switch protein FliG
LENVFNMKKEEFENIVKEQSNLKNLPNQKLVEFMDLLSSDFDATKESIINSTRYLDKVEELYNKTLKVYQERNNHE